jgi:hypothetical protein
MDNPETQKKKKTNKHIHTQRTKMRSNSNPTKKSEMNSYALKE